MHNLTALLFLFYIQVKNHDEQVISGNEKSNSHVQRGEVFLRGGRLKTFRKISGEKETRSMRAGPLEGEKNSRGGFVTDSRNAVDSLKEGKH